MATCRLADAPLSFSYGPQSGSLAVATAAGAVDGLTVYSVSGAVVARCSGGASRIVFDASGLVPGVYVAKAGAAGASGMFKFVVR